MNKQYFPITLKTAYLCERFRETLLPIDIAFQIDTNKEKRSFTKYTEDLRSRKK